MKSFTSRYKGKINMGQKNINQKLKKYHPPIGNITISTNLPDTSRYSFLGDHLTVRMDFLCPLSM